MIIISVVEQENRAHEGVECVTRQEGLKYLQKWEIRKNYEIGDAIGTVGKESSGMSKRREWNGVSLSEWQRIKNIGTITPFSIVNSKSDLDSYVAIHPRNTYIGSHLGVIIWNYLLTKQCILGCSTF